MTEAPLESALSIVLPEQRVTEAPLESAPPVSPKQRVAEAPVEEERAAVETEPRVAGTPPRGSFRGAGAEEAQFREELPLFFPFLRMPFGSAVFAAVGAAPSVDADAGGWRKVTEPVI